MPTFMVTSVHIKNTSAIADPILTIFWQFFLHFLTIFYSSFLTFSTILTILPNLDDFDNSDHFHNLDNFHNSAICFCHFDNLKDYPGDLWHLRHWLQFWQLRTWIHENLCYLTINCDTGQHRNSCDVLSYLTKITMFSFWIPS